MLTIELTFTAGRYSATPWGHHANEGLVEWPPSPWRLLRALVAVWKTSLPEADEEQVAAVLCKLAMPPSYTLPLTTTGHSRHYMPWYKKGPRDRTLLFDAFVCVDRKIPLIISWPGADLSDDERRLLASLLDRLPYLGRAESWCRAGLGHGGYVPNAMPIGEGEAVPDSAESTELLAAELPLNLAALFVDTAQLHKDRRGISRPPGAHWLRYRRPAGCLNGPAAGVYAAHLPTVEVAHFTLQGSVLPSVLKAVQVGEVARRAAMSRYGAFHGGAPSLVLSGKDRQGKPLQDHRHAFYLPTDEDQDGYLDHLNVYAPMGFGSGEQLALGSIVELDLDQGHPLRLVLTALGDRRDLGDLEPFAQGSEWHSVTPFVLARHPKFYGSGKPRLLPDGTQRDGPSDQLRREIAQRADLPDLESCESMPTCQLAGRRLSWQDYRRWREQRGRGPAEAMGYGFVLRFQQPAIGPIALGYGCHFGLGQFRCVKEEAR